MAWTSVSTIVEPMNSTVTRSAGIAVQMISSLLLPCVWPRQLGVVVLATEAPDHEQQQTFDEHEDRRSDEEDGQIQAGGRDALGGDHFMRKPEAVGGLAKEAGRSAITRRVAVLLLGTRCQYQGNDRDRCELGKAAYTSTKRRDAQGLSPVSNVPSSGPAYYSGLMRIGVRRSTVARIGRPTRREFPGLGPLATVPTLAFAAMLAKPAVVIAHGQAPVEPSSAVLIEGWTFAVDVWLPLILAALLYWQARSIVDRRHPEEPGTALAHVVVDGWPCGHRGSPGLTHRVLRHHALLGTYDPAPVADHGGGAALGAGRTDHAAAARGLARGAQASGSCRS